MDGITPNVNIEQSKVIGKQELANIIKQYIKQVAKQAKQAKIKYLAIEYIDRSQILIDKTLKIYTNESMLEISQFESEIKLKLYDKNNNIVYEREINFEIDLKKLYNKLINLKTIKNLEQIAINLAIETYNKLFNCNLKIEDVKIYKSKNLGIIIEKPFYCEVCEYVRNGKIVLLEDPDVEIYEIEDIEDCELEYFVLAKINKKLINFKFTESDFLEPE